MSVGPADIVTVVAAAMAATTVLSCPPQIRPRRCAPAPVESGGTDLPAALVAPEPAPSLAVRLLGPIEVQQAGKPVALTARQLELVALLAAHPAGVTEDRLRASLWGDRPVTRGAFNNLVSQTRRRLGVIDGEAVLPAVGGDRLYRLHPSVTCDLTLLDGTDERAAGDRLLAAVRGRPFEVSHGYGWVDREGLTHWAATRISAVAHRLATEHLAAGFPARALEAAQRGLLGAPGEEGLFRDRMLAHAALGHTAAVERVMIELLAVLDGDDPAEVLHPDTLAVYRRCGRGAAVRNLTLR